MVVGNDVLITTDNPSAAGGAITYVDDINIATGAKVGTTIAMHGVTFFGPPELVGNDVLITTDNPSAAGGGITYVDDINTTTGARWAPPSPCTASPPSAHRTWSAMTS